MALAHFLIVLLLGTTPLLFSSAEAGEGGVSYGTVADKQPDPANLLQLLRDNGITMVKIYDTKSRLLISRANNDIRVMVMMPNEDIAATAADPSYALQWVKSKVAAYHPATQIHGVAVGNEVFKWKPELNPRLVPAMTNVQAALAQLGLADAMKVSTPIAVDALKESSPPSAGRFKDDIVSVMRPMLDFLQRTGSYLIVNIYHQPSPFDYPLPLNRFTGARYFNLLDAMYHAMEALSRSAGRRVMLALTVTEIGSLPAESWCVAKTAVGDARLKAALDYVYVHPARRDVLPAKHHGRARLLCIQQLLPKQGPGIRDVQLQRCRLRRLPATNWESVGDGWLQAAREYECGSGADCSAIQPGTSYALKSYYQHNGQASGACNFSGAGSVVYQPQKIRSCGLPPYKCLNPRNSGEV